MAQRKTLQGNACPVARSVDVVGDRWALLIVRDAFDGLRRFGEFQRSLGVAKNILADRLRKLVAQGILATGPMAEGSAYQDYALTAKGEALFPVIVGLRQWGEHHLYGAGETHSVLKERHGGAPVPPMAVRAQDGRRLAPEMTVVEKPRDGTAAPVPPTA